ncbi:MAG: dTDP-4-dehydrorhamnose reductase [Ruminococcus sp.]|jgi:dTDP-4-dehydrorhamnose reductase|nr:dTDP-4-dehydrorhamnose reductase [Ruminococcus sp.]
MIFVTGVTGQVGSECADILGGRAVAPSETELDLTDRAAVADFFAANPDIEAVIHCAAYTAVDRAEDDRERCFAVNETATANIAAEAAKIGAKMLYVSTDYVFDGKKNSPYKTDDSTNPQSVYGESKLAGEIAVKNAYKDNSNRFFIVRTQWVYGNGNNFVKTMLRLFAEKDAINVVSDQFGCPTYARDLAATLCEMIGTEKFGVYHASGAGECSWYDFAKQILQLSDEKCLINAVFTKDYPTKAVRPAYSVLSKESLKIAGFKALPDWKTSLKAFLS